MTIILILLKASLLLGATLGGAWLLRAAPAAMRHTLWSVTFAALLTLPLLGAVLPQLDVPLPAAWAAAAVAPITSADTATPGLKTGSPGTPGVNTPPTPDALPTSDA